MAQNPLFMPVKFRTFLLSFCDENNQNRLKVRFCQKNQQNHLISTGFSWKFAIL